MGCDVLGTDLSNPTARAEMNAGDLVQIKDNVTGDTDQTTVGEFLSNGKFDKYGSPEDRLKILQGGTWKNAQGTPYKSSLPIGSGFERYRDQLNIAYQDRETVKKFVDGALYAKASRVYNSVLDIELSRIRWLGNSDDNILIGFAEAAALEAARKYDPKFGK